MNVRITWTAELPNTVIWKIEPTWTMHDYERAVERTRRMVQKRAPDVIDVLVDMTETLTVPSRALGAVVRCHFGDGLSANYGVSVIVSQKPIVQVIYPVLAKAPSTHNRIYLARTIDEARVVLMRARQSRL